MVQNMSSTDDIAKNRKTYFYKLGGYRRVWHKHIPWAGKCDPKVPV